MRELKDWLITAPWGKLALKSWGNPSGDPIFLLHGRQDSAATFVPLLKLLPDTYHYVCLDLPGHGKSDPMPTGVSLLRIHFVGAVDVALTHLKWNKFIFMSHSMGSEIGLFYNAIYPGQITKFILLDPGMSFYRIRALDHPKYFESYFEEYYKNYDSYNVNDKIYSKRQALEAVKKARGLTEEQAELVLSRNLKPVGDDKYQLSWDRRLKFPGGLNIPNTYFLELFTKSAPPTFIVSADSTGQRVLKDKETLQQLIKGFVDRLKICQLKIVHGDHDVHLKHPELIADDICEFLKQKKFTSKL